MDGLKIKGTVIAITELEENGNFKKRELIVKTDGQYPQVLSCEFVNAKEELLDVVNVGEKVEVSVNLRGREWVNPEGVTKYFMSLGGWKVEVK